MRKRKLTNFGEQVKKRLFYLNMTQKTLARKVGTSEAYLSMILYGERSGSKYKDMIENILLMNTGQDTENKQKSIEE
ncbi:helix-turn-helix domain-containing protein [Alkaliphilus sp. B6464]|uniref:helix-turn-helix domain-containing protein n=1 Tax=Alkaliphilus sp. B6464 TaxID=2731219 RepID=UPI001BA5AD9C|nr:helix-turn-helix transcriptional regulator [Alkaliphilus sp. B6464]QUH19305.1 helix-turn-helix transcriptional regulator [Alkaliphilus sp. B6464]